MAMRYHPGKRTPFVEQKSTQPREGRGMGLGAVVFIIIILGVLYLALVVTPPLMEDMVLPDIGIPYSTLFFIVLGVIILAIIVVAVRGGASGGNKSAYKDRDPSMRSRVIRDGPDGEEFIISDAKEETFGQACRKNWQFTSVNLNSKWYIKDEKGNDVTDRFLESADGVFLLVSEYGSEMPKEETDESDEYSSIHDSVTYYD
ncbi:MAG: hypothetical protein RTV31_09335 [Candidatus Thorarchaeota archaeon]